MATRIRKAHEGRDGSAWIAKRPTKSGTTYRVMFRTGGRESAPRDAGAFRTKREARIRRDWVAGELAAMRVPDLTLLAEKPPAPLLRESRPTGRSRGSTSGRTPASSTARPWGGF